MPEYPLITLNDGSDSSSSHRGHERGWNVVRA
jgi:hypothetical protein